MPSIDRKTTVTNGPKATAPRKADNDPLFRNDVLGKLQEGKVPYGKGQTYVDPNPDREEYLRKTEGLTAMQRVEYRCERSHGGETLHMLT